MKETITQILKVLGLPFLLFGILVIGTIRGIIAHIKETRGK